MFFPTRGRLSSDELRNEPEKCWDCATIFTSFFFFIQRFFFNHDIGRDNRCSIKEWSYLGWWNKPVLRSYSFTLLMTGLQRDPKPKIMCSWHSWAWTAVSLFISISVSTVNQFTSLPVKKSNSPEFFIITFLKSSKL